ncbi:unnamed protein product [Trichobilharzia regenti]|nr:unnamed protein product [Trichobilharzia regenti]
MNIKNLYTKWREITSITNQNNLHKSHEIYNHYYSQEFTVSHQRNWNKPKYDERLLLEPNEASQPTGTLAADALMKEGINNYPELRKDESDHLTGNTFYQSSLENPNIVHPTVDQNTQNQPASRISIREEEKYFIPSSPKSNAPRMIQSENGRTVPENAFRRLKHMGLAEDATEKLPDLPPPGDLGANGYPELKSIGKKPTKKYPTSKEYQLTRCLCCWTTFIMIVIGLCAIGTLILAGILFDAECLTISIGLVILNLFILIIITLEWIRMWLWREPSENYKCKNSRAASFLVPKENAGSGSLEPSIGIGFPNITSQPMVMPASLLGYTYSPVSKNQGGFLSPGPQQRLYDIPQFVSAICLLILYIFAAICICVTFSESKMKVDQCKSISAVGLGYSIMLAILIVIRMLLCCRSDACQGLCYTMKTKSSDRRAFVPIVAVNQLHQVLPGLGQMHASGNGNTRNSQPTGWLNNLAISSDPSQQLSMIQPMPVKFSQDITP